MNCSRKFEIGDVFGSRDSGPDCRVRMSVCDAVGRSSKRKEEGWEIGIIGVAPKLPDELSCRSLKCWGDINHRVR